MKPTSSYQLSRIEMICFRHIQYKDNKHIMSEYVQINLLNDCYNSRKKDPCLDYQIHKIRIISSIILQGVLQATCTSTFSQFILENISWYLLKSLIPCLSIHSICRNLPAIRHILTNLLRISIPLAPLPIRRWISHLILLKNWGKRPVLTYIVTVVPKGCSYSITLKPLCNYHI